MIAEGPLDHLDHAPTLQFVGGKLGIDATAKSPAEGAREWPSEIEMSDGGPRARRPPLGRSTGSLRMPGRGVGAEWRVGAGCGSCYVVDTASRLGIESTEGTLT